MNEDEVIDVDAEIEQAQAEAAKAEAEAKAKAQRLQALIEQKKKKEESRKKAIKEAAIGVVDVLKAERDLLKPIIAFSQEWEIIRDKHDAAYRRLTSATDQQDVRAHYETNTALYPEDFATATIAHRQTVDEFVRAFRSLEPVVAILEERIKGPAVKRTRLSDTP